MFSKSSIYIYIYIYTISSRVNIVFCIASPFDPNFFDDDYEIFCSHARLRHMMDK